MKTQLNSPKRMGRPPTDGPIKRPFNVMLDPRVAEGLRAYGDDNLSIGVALAAAKAAERRSHGGRAAGCADGDVGGTVEAQG